MPRSTQTPAQKTAQLKAELADQLRRGKTPAVLAEQHQVNSVLSTRKAGAHRAPNKAQRLAEVKLREQL